MYRVIIADDNEAMRSILRRIIERNDKLTLAAEASDGEQLLEAVEKNRPDIVFLDVEMPKMTGVECARCIQDINPAIIIVFATAHDDYMSDAFELYAFDYLLKPFKLERVEQTLEKIVQRLDERGQSGMRSVVEKPMVAQGRMMLRHKEGVSVIDFQDLLLIQRENRSTVLYLCENRRYETNLTLTELEERLPKDVFFRCHKSYIINLNYIQDIMPYGRWTYIVRLEGTAQDALITHEKYEELEELFR